jgi:hypothetical protein
MLTIFQQRRLELWSVPDGKRLYSVELEPAPMESRHAVAVRADRRLVAIANAKQGFTFHDTANGAVLGRTAAMPGKLSEMNHCAFTPDGKHFGCELTMADPPREKWLMWSCPAGAIKAQWDRPVGGGWVFWDDRFVLAGNGAVPQCQLFEARNGKAFGSVDTSDGNFLAVSTGRRLWYTCGEPLGPVQLASIELQPQWLQNPVPNRGFFRQWSLNRDGLSNRP